MIDDVTPNLNEISRIDTVSPFWEAELPQHTSCIFRTNQDERHRGNCAIVQPGYGPLGHMRGQGDNANFGGESGSINAGGQGRAHLKYRWIFESGIGIQKRATISVELRMVEWARQALTSLWGPGYMQFWPYVAGGDHNTPDTDVIYKPAAFGIQVLMTGRRQVQQRGEYHV